MLRKGSQRHIICKHCACPPQTKTLGIQKVIALDRDRLVRGFLVAPLAAPLLFVFTATLVGLIDSIRRTDSEGIFWGLFGQWVWLIFALPISYGLTVFPGVPVFYLLRHQHQPHLWYWVSASSVLGLVSGALAAVALHLVSQDQVLRFGAFAAVCAAVNGWAFWRLAVRTLDKAPRP